MADPFDRGTLTYDELAKVLKNSRYHMSNTLIDDIFADCPKNLAHEAKYRDLHKKIEAMGMPNTYYSLIPTKPNPSRTEDIEKILNPKIPMVLELKSEELENYGLGRVNLDVLQGQEKEKSEKEGNLANTFDIHNSRVLLENFPIYLSQSLVTAAMRGKVDLPDSVKHEYMYKLLDRKSLEKFTNINGYIYH